MDKNLWLTFLAHPVQSALRACIIPFPRLRQHGAITVCCRSYPKARYCQWRHNMHCSSLPGPTESLHLPWTSAHDIWSSLYCGSVSNSSSIVERDSDTARSLLSVRHCVKTVRHIASIFTALSLSFLLREARMCVAQYCYENVVCQSVSPSVTLVDWIVISHIEIVGK